MPMARMTPERVRMAEPIRNSGHGSSTELANAVAPSLPVMMPIIDRVGERPRSTIQ